MRWKKETTLSWGKKKLTVVISVCVVVFSGAAVHGVFTALVEVVVRPRICQPGIVSHVGSKQAWSREKGHYIHSLSTLLGTPIQQHACYLISWSCGRSTTYVQALWKFKLISMFVYVVLNHWHYFSLRHVITLCHHGQLVKYLRVNKTIKSKKINLSLCSWQPRIPVVGWQ